MKFQPVHQEESLHKIVVRQIEQSILEKALKPGDRLPTEVQLATQFGVSRTVIREAIMMLRQARLVEVRHGVGTFIAEPLPEDSSDQLTQLFHQQKNSLWEVHEVRRVLEPELAGIAAERIDEEDLAELREIFVEMEASTGDAEKFSELDLSFHNAIAAATRNSMFSLILTPMMNIMVENRKLGALAPGALEETLVAHEAIIKAIESRDPIRARLAMSAHLDRVSQDLRNAERIVAQAKPDRDIGIGQ